MSITDKIYLTRVVFMLSLSDSVGYGIMFPPRSSVCPDRSCYHDISWTARAVSIKRTGNIRQPLLMTWLAYTGQRSKSRSQQAVELAKASTWTLRRPCPSSGFIAS